MPVNVEPSVPPVSVPTADEFQAQAELVEALQGQIFSLQGEVADLERRIETLEGAPPDTGEPPDPEPEPEPPDPGDLSCIITIGGETFHYDVTEGRDLGNFRDSIGPLIGQGERFSMSCVRVEHTGCPIRVDFRQVIGTGWWCAVFDYGDATGVSGPLLNLPAMTVAIGGETIELWGHPWGTRWRWQSGPWPFEIIPIDDLVTAGLLLDYDPEVPCGTAPKGFTATYTPLAYESAGLMPGMPSTGSRQDIGLTTDLQAQYINGACDLSGVLAQGEAAASVPWRLYDSARGRTIDVLADYRGVAIEGNGSPRLYHQLASTFSATFTGTPGASMPGYITVRTPSGQEFNAGPPGGVLPASGAMDGICWEQGWGSVDPSGGTVIDTAGSGLEVTIIDGSFVPSSGIFPDSAHQPAISYLPFILTGDPYFLENLGSQVAFAFAENGTDGMNYYTPGIIQTRGGAWNTRSIAQAAYVTPEDAPSWLLSRASMQAALDWCIAGMTQLIAAPPYPSVTTFHDPHASSWTYKTPWQTDFWILVSAHVTKLHERYRPILQWMVQHAIARLDGKSGWGRGSPDPYQLFIGTPHENYAQHFYGSWGEAWTGNTGGDAASAAASNLSMAKPPDGQGDYCNGLLAALSAATQVLADDDPLLVEVRACIDYLFPYHQSWMRNGFTCEYKWSFSRE